jgi:hypothetical protein
MARRFRLLAGITALVSIGLVAPLPAAGQAGDAGRSAATYFHDAAQQYIAENTSRAQQLVEAGLDAHPEDPRLQALQAKLDRARQQSAGSDSSSQSQGGRSSESGEKGPPSSSEDNRDGAEPGEGRSKPPSSSPETSADGRSQPQDASNPSAENRTSGDRNPDNRKAGDRNASNRDASNQDAPNRSGAERRPSASPSASPQDPGSAAAGGSQGREQRAARGRLTRAQAERILHALQGQEKQLLREVQKRSGQAESVEKDW